MDPVYEQGLRDEVVYLHSLWRQGPPSNHHHHHLNPPSSFAARTTASPFHRLQPSNPIHFKKNKHKTIINLVQEHRNKLSWPKFDSGPEWPIPKSPEILSNSSSGWPQLNLPPKTHLPSPEELARLAYSDLQQRTMKATRDFFDDDDNSEDEEGHDRMEDDDDDDDERKEYNFFLKIFNEDSDLRNYYVSKWKCSEFFCLVCGGIANKGSKRFKNCLALVQHSISIQKTKKKAHRAYAEVICKVLAWDINQLSIYSSMLAKPKSGDSEIQTLQAVGNDSNSESMQNVVALLHKDEIVSNVEESFANNPTENVGLSTGDDASKQEEAAAVVNQLCGRMSSNMVLETGEAMAMWM